MGDRFMVKGRRVTAKPEYVWSRTYAQSSKGSIQLCRPKNNAAVVHLIGMSEEFASGNMSRGSGKGLLLASSDKRFVWASIAHILRDPGIPGMANWFATN